MSPPAAARLDEHEDAADRDDETPPTLPPEVRAILRQRLSEIDDLRAKGLLIEDDDALYADL